MTVFLVSAGVAGSGTAALFALAAVLAQVYPFSIVLRYVYYRIGSTPIVVATSVVLFVVAVFTMMGGTLKRIRHVSEAVNRIAEGNLDARAPLESNDEIGLLARDVNAMAERLKKSIQEERDAERSKYDLVTSVSHDLRTPLTSILGYLDLVTGDNYEDEVHLRHYVEVAHEKALSLKRLIDDLFEFTRVSHGGLPQRPELINLGRLLEQLSEEFVPILDRAHMQYRLKIPQESVMIEADASMMVRVFENLVSNAVRYGSDGVYIDIELESEQGDAWSVVRVANYGSPIDEAQLALIFERFYRAEVSRSRETGGAGLGLAIAKSIVTLHGGEIRAFNDHEQGRTVFEVRLPKKAGPPASG